MSVVTPVPGGSVPSEDPVQDPSTDPKDGFAAAIIFVGLVTSYVSVGLMWGWKPATALLGVVLMVIGVLVGISES